jgi:hypothetical protein
MLTLKDLCLSPNSQYPYITSLTGGKDNSHEGLQVCLGLDRSSAR